MKDTTTTNKNQLLLTDSNEIVPSGDGIDGIDLPPTESADRQLMPAPPKKNQKRTLLDHQMAKLKTDLKGVSGVVDVPRTEDDMSIASALTENTIATRSKTSKKNRTGDQNQVS